MNYITTTALETFFDSLKMVKLTNRKKKDGYLVEHLPEFFNHLRLYLHSIPIDKKPIVINIPNAESLAIWLDALREPIAKSKASGIFCNPWQLLKLGTDEVRNSTILAWLVNPRSDHGLGNIFLLALLNELQRIHPDFAPELVDSLPSVNTEICPENDQTNRVDIEINAANFYLIIEVKINAIEGEKQLERYGEIAKKQARNKPWAIVFLTRRGGKSTTSGIHKDKVISLSWIKIARIFRKALENHVLHDSADRFSPRLVELYLRHISNFY